MRNFFLAVIGLSLSACASVQRQVADDIGCPREKVRILETDPGFGRLHTVYRASCQDRQYICNQNTEGRDREMKCSSLNARQDKGASAGYLGQDDLVDEKKQRFDDFLQNLSEPETTKQ